MRLPRDLSGRQVANRLRKLDYQITRQTGSHIRLTTQRDGEHHLTIPDHNPLRIGTLNSIIKSLCDRHRLTRDEVIQWLSD